MDEVEGPWFIGRAGRAPAADSERGGSGNRLDWISFTSHGRVETRSALLRAVIHRRGHDRVQDRRHPPSPTSSPRTRVLRCRRRSTSPPLGESPHRRQWLWITSNTNDKHNAALIPCSKFWDDIVRTLYNKVNICMHFYRSVS